MLKYTHRQSPKQDYHLKGEFSSDLPSLPVFFLISRETRELFCELAEKINCEQNLVQNSEVVRLQVGAKDEAAHNGAHDYIALLF